MVLAELEACKTALEEDGEAAVPATDHCMNGSYGKHW